MLYTKYAKLQAQNAVVSKRAKKESKKENERMKNERQKCEKCKEMMTAAVTDKKSNSVPAMPSFLEKRRNLTFLRATLLTKPSAC